ncbi:hemagglutinin [Influenza A virus (A/little yellow-shouldered bat/Guatemala/060/2010(H17N10))]|uniref:Hemagglutinin n=1 Tax=Influenza A virus (A/little yellow-shouldered bat/Guatemala/060/2010(H17N10)) TaxID=1129347 RepID=H6QM93_9INFA|nr:hemagglutinin [Influenza A virus (A/little yellow-shouldered bat/Guatemala/060/2010(H17N10))]
MELIILLILLNPYTFVLGDRICIGYQANQNNQTVNTLLEQNVPVTGAQEILETNHNGKLCSLNGVPPLDLQSCTLAGWLLGNPNCDNLLEAEEWSYIKINENAPDDLCFPGNFENLQDLLLEMSGVQNFTKVKLFNPQSMTGVTTNNVDQTCPFEGKPSFYRNLNWIQGNSGLPFNIEIKNPTSNPLLLLWGIHNTKDAAQQRNLYGNDYSYTIFNFGEKSEEFRPDIGQRDEIKAHQDRIDYYWGSLPAQSTLRIESTGNLIAPEYGFYYKRKEGKGGLMKSKLPISDCSTKCQTPLGALNSTLPFQNVHQQTIGNCPKYVKATSLMLATGLRNNPQMEGRGLFGAIAGFIEGGWQGMIDGWYGYHHENQEGSGYAADKEATQKAVDAITNKVNSIIDKMNSQFESNIKEFNRLELRIQHLSDRVDDALLDIWSYNTELLVLLENERTLDFHDANVKNLFEKVKAQLKDNAIDEGNGCFLLLHKCNNSCMDDIKNGTYKYMDYREESHIEKQKIDGVKLTDYSRYYTMTLYSTIASSVVLGSLIIAAFLWGCQKGSIQCKICI